MDVNVHKRKKLSTKEIQDVSLSIMKKLHVYLKQHRLRYSLYGGTLIGAIRHKGFIPWDDDVDIAMPQPDYERLLEEWEDTEELKLFAPEKGNSRLLFARMCDMKMTDSFERVPWRDGNSGVWVDIFPITAVPTDMDAHIKHIKQMAYYGKRSYYSRYSDVTPSMFNSFRDKVLALFKMWAFRWINRKKILRDAHNLAFETNDYAQTKYVGEVVFLDYPDCEHLPKQWWETFEETRFEDAVFSIVSNYDNVLRNYYGNYMELPPIEKRNPMHASGQCFFWREQQ